MVRSSITPKDQIKNGYEYALFKNISSSTLLILESLYADALADYKKHPAEAKKLVNEANSELAAMTIVASAILNLDELITN
jgi:hypothetical protein